MNKTVSINLGGWFFHIEEEAYQNLDIYLSSIQRYFAAEDAGTEIVEDIEGRIAEMFQEVLNKTKRQVIVTGDVLSIIKVMGVPEQFDQVTENEAILVNGTIVPTTALTTISQKQTENNSSSQSNSQTAQDNRTANRRLYRNTDDKVIGGVCSGLSAYFGINDPIWIRLAFAVSFFVFGYGILIYLLMMVIVPPAKTSAQKLAMKGEPINIENIEKTVREGVSSLQSRIEEFQNSESGRKTGDFFSKTIERFQEIAPAAGSIGLTVLKWVGLVFGAIFIFSLVVGLIGTLVGVLSSLKFLIQFVFSSPMMAIALVICGTLLIGIPIVAISYLLLKKIFRLRPDNNRKWLTGMGSLWSISLAAFSVLSFNTYQSDFDRAGKDQQIVTLTQPQGNTLYLEATGSNKAEEKEHDVQIENSYFDTKNGKFYINDVQLDVEKSDNGQFELVKKISTRAGNEENAKQLIKQIDYEFDQNDSVLYLNTYFNVGNSKWRGQDIQLTLRVPIGKSIFFTPSSEDIIYDVKNITNTYDGDMIGLSWTMTERGLMLSPNQANRPNSKQLGTATGVNNNIESPDKEALQNSFVKEAHEPKGDEIQKTLDLEDFSELAITGDIDVRVVKGDSYKVVLTGQAAVIENASVDVSGNTLSAALGQSKEQGLLSSKAPIGLYIVMPTLDEMALSGNCTGQISGFSQEEIIIALSGSTALQAQLEVENAEIALSGASILTLMGRSNNLSLGVSNSAALRGLNFEAEEITVELSGASLAEVSVVRQIDAEISGASILRYKGNPEGIQLDKSDSGKVEQLK